MRCGVGAAFLDAAPCEAPAAPQLVCVGRLVERKGHALLLEALARLAREGIAFRLAVLGDGPLRGALEARCAELGLQGAVRFRGWASEDEVLRDIVAARALVLPSFAEGLPVVLMEALALGRPVVCADIAGHSELVENGVSGWLVPVDSLAALVAALREVLSLAPAELSRRGRAGRVRVARLHDARREAARLAELLRASARSPSRQPGDRSPRHERARRQPVAPRCHRAAGSRARALRRGGGGGAPAAASRRTCLADRGRASTCSCPRTTRRPASRRPSPPCYASSRPAIA